MATDQHSDNQPKQDAKTSAEASAVEKRLDHGIKESFPGSDPVSVNVSKYAPGDSEEAGGDKGTPDDVAGIANRTWDEVADRASKGSEAIAEGLRNAAPVMKRQTERMRSTMRAHPVSTAIIAGLVGCGVALVAYEAFSQSGPKKLKRRAYGADEIS